MIKKKLRSAPEENSHDTATLPADAPAIEAPSKKISAEKLSDPDTSVSGRGGKLQILLRKLTSKRLLPILVLVIVVVLSATAYAITPSRYVLLNSVSSADAQLTIVNATTKQPVSGAIVTLKNGSSTETNEDGLAIFTKTKYGKTTASVQKNTYESTTFEVEIKNRAGSLGTFDLKPNGVPINIKSMNWLSNKPVNDFAVLAESDDTEIAVSKDGTAVLNIPYETPKVTYRISADGYVQQKITIDINDEKIQKNPSSKNEVSVLTAELVLSGEHHFVSNRDGDIGFYSVKYDGSDVQKLVTTNQKTDYLEYYSIPNTKEYIALFSSNGKDNGGRKDQLVVIKPDQKSFKVVDEAPGEKLDFSVIAVTKSVIIYQVNYETERDDRYKIKSYNFETGKLTTHYSFRAYISPIYDAERNNIYLIERVGNYPHDPGFLRRIIRVGLQDNVAHSIAEGSNFGYVTLSPSEPDKLLYSVETVYYNTVQAGYYVVDLADNSKFGYLGPNWPEFDVPDEIPDSEKGQASPDKTNRVWIDIRDNKGRLILNDAKNVLSGQIDSLSVNNIIRWINETQLTVTGSDTAGVADYIVDIETGNYKKITETLQSQYGGY